MNGPFSMAMLNNQRVTWKYSQKWEFATWIRGGNYQKWLFTNWWLVVMLQMGTSCRSVVISGRKVMLLRRVFDGQLGSAVNPSTAAKKPIAPIPCVLETWNPSEPTKQNPDNFRRQFFQWSSNLSAEAARLSWGWPCPAGMINAYMSSSNSWFII